MKNLLELPDIPLEKVFRYSKGSLVKLTEVNKFTKSFIENRLMDKLKLNIPDHHRDLSCSKEEKAAYVACLNSTRKFSAVTIGACEAYEPRSLDPETSVKILLDKHAETLKEFNVQFLATNVGSGIVEDILEYTENLTNLEKVLVIFLWEGDDLKHKHNWLEKAKGYGKYKKKFLWKDSQDEYDSSESDFETDWTDKDKKSDTVDEFDSSSSTSSQSSDTKDAFPNKFAHLKFLHIQREANAVYNFFKHCKTLETIELTTLGEEDDESFVNLCPLLYNSHHTLKNLKICFDFEFDIQHSRMNECFLVLKSSKTNLTTFELVVPETNYWNSNQLSNFLRTQKNLEILKLKDISGIVLFNKSGSLISGLEKLKILDVTLVYDDPKQKKYKDMPLVLGELEDLKIDCKKSSILCEKLVDCASDKLKKLKITGGVPANFFEMATENFPNLLELRASDLGHICSSNDILYILKNLKKLRVIEFEFPKKSALQSDLFDPEDDLTLPDIEQVELEFNDLVSLDNATKLIKYLSNASTFEFNKWRHYKSDFLVTITKEMPNLKKFTFFQYYTKNLDLTILEKIKENVKEFNKNPALFRIDGHTVDFWMEKVKKDDSEPQAKKFKYC